MYDQHPFVPLPFVWNLSGAGLDPTRLQQPSFKLLDAFSVQEVCALPVGFIGRKGAEAGCLNGLSQTAAACEEFNKEDDATYSLLPAQNPLA